MSSVKSKVYVGMSNYDDVNWYLQEGYFVANPNELMLPGYFTLEFDLNEKADRDKASKLIYDAREKGIKMTTDDGQMLRRLNFYPEKLENVRILSTGHMAEGMPGEWDSIYGYSGEADYEGIDLKVPEDILIPAPTTEERKLQLKRCSLFLIKVAEELKDTHEIVPSSNKTWGSACLIPIGTINELNYEGKPVNSLRVACNWNWRASLKHCPNERMIQCLTDDMPWCRKRKGEGLASSPVWGNMVGYYGADRKYHCVYGEKYDRASGKWSWVDGDVHAVAQKMREEQQKILAQRTAVFHKLDK